MKKFINKFKINNKIIKQELTQKEILDLLDSIIENRMNYKNGFTKDNVINGVNLMVNDIIYQTDKLNTKFLKKIRAIYRHMLNIKDISQDTQNEINFTYMLIGGAIQHFETHKFIDNRYKELEKQKLKARN